MNKKTLPTIYYLTSLIFYVICVIKFFNSSASGGSTLVAYRICIPILWNKCKKQHIKNI